MAIYADSVGNTYASLPAKKAQKGAKGAKPGPKHGGNPNKGGPQKAHGQATDTNGSPWYVHLFAQKGRRAPVETKWGRAAGGLELGQ